MIIYISHSPYSVWRIKTIAHTISTAIIVSHVITSTRIYASTCTSIHINIHIHAYTYTLHGLDGHGLFNADVTPRLALFDAKSRIVEGLLGIQTIV